MPKSKRNKVVTLTKTDPKGKGHKDEFLQNIREAVENFTDIYVFHYENMRNNLLKDLRAKFASSKFFIGKNKVMMVALGRSSEEEIKTDLHKLTEHLSGNCGLFFTNESFESVKSFFDEYSVADYARYGSQATEAFTVQEGALPQFGHSMEPHLRKIGLPTSLKTGVIHCDRDYEVCQVGTVLTADQAKILRVTLQTLCRAKDWFMDANEAGFVDLLHQHLLQGEVMDAEQILSIHGFKNYVGLNGNTTLHYATNAKSATLVRSLLEAGANPNACNHQGDSPLHLACYNGTVDLVEILVKFGSDVNKPGFGRLAPIHHAVQSRSIEICKFLIANGAHIDARDSTESTPLHIASRINDCFLAEFLVERGCFVNATDNELFTPLHVAASHGFEAMCRTLLAKGANAHALNRLQETPHQIAIHSQAHSVASLLAKHTRPSGVTATATTSSSTSRSIPVQGLATSSASALASIHRSPFTHISHAGPVSSSGSVSSITRPYAVAPGSVHASPQGSTRGYTSPSFHSATRSSTPTVPERVSSPRVFLSPPLSARHYNSTAVATTSSSSSSALERAYGHGQKYDFTPRDHLSGSASSSAYLGALVTPRAWANSRPEIPLSSNVPYSQNTRLTTMSESKIVIPRPSQQPSRHIAESQSHLLPNPNHGATTPNGLHKAEEKESHQSDQFPIGNMYQSVASLFPLQETEQSQETHSDTEIDVDTQKVSQVIETQSPNIQQQVEVVPVQDERQPQESHLSSATMNPQPTPEPEVKQESLPSARSSSAFVSPLSQVVIKQVYTDYNPDPVVEISEPSASPLPNNTATITTIEPARPLSLHVQGGFGLASPAAPRMYGALSFDIEQVKEFVMSPGPATLHECTIRKRFIDGHDAYVLIEESTGKHLLTAFKKINSRTSNYAIILTNNYVRRKHPNYLGKLRGNFLRNTYNMYDKGSNPARTSQDMAISTCRSELGMVMISEKSPRNMSILIPIIHNNQHLSIVPMRKSETLKNRYDRHGEDPDIMILHSRLPTWHAKSNSYNYHFQGRPRVPHKRNFQMEIEIGTTRNVVLQLGRLADGDYGLDFMYPLSAIQAFCTAISSLDTF